MAILIQDSFTGADGTIITSHAPEVGGAWFAGSGPPQIISNQCKNVATGFHSFSNATTTLDSDRYAQANIWCAAGGSVSLYLGTQGTNDYATIGTSNIYLNGVAVGRPYVAGSFYKIERIGLIVTLYEDSIAIVQAATFGSNTPHWFGAELASINTIIDNFEAGTSVAPSSPTLLTATCSTGIGESTLPDAPGTSFSADVQSGLAPLTVQFTDHSSNTPTAWSWEDETGVFSTSQNPSRIFTTGIHTVKLTATNAQGAGVPYQMTIIATDTPVVTPPDGGTVTPGGTIPGETLQGLLGRIGYYAVDTAEHTVKIYGLTGSLLKTAGGIGQTAGKFFMPTTVSVINGKQALDRVTIEED